MCVRCEARIEYEQNRDDELEIGRPWAPGFCWLKRFADTPCDGRIDPAHLIAKSRLKRERVPKEAWWDPRIIVPVCRRHHGAFDTARTLRVPRGALPASVEAFVEEHGLEWALDREYGLPREAA